MRELQRGGRYALYSVLVLAVFFGLGDENKTLASVFMLVVLMSVPGYWFWTRARHRREHHDHSDDSCAHCRGEFTYAREQRLRREREAAMDRFRTHGTTVQPTDRFRTQKPVPNTKFSRRLDD